MKAKYIISTAFAASFVMIACNKVPTMELPEGTPVSFSVASPSIDSDDAEEGTKLTAILNDKTYSFEWTKGDQIALIAYKKPAAANETNYTKISPFTASASGTTTTFTGTIPADFNPEQTEIWAIYPNREDIVVQKSAANTLTVSKDTHPFRYNLKTSIPSVQDGKGFSASTFTSIFGSIAKENDNYSINVPNFRLGNALIAMKVKAAYNIKKIELQAWHEGGTKTNYKEPHYQPICGDGNIIFVDVDYAVNSGGDASKILTVKKDDDSCYGDETILIATRQTVSNANYGKGELRFTFTDSSDKKAYMKVNLYTTTNATTTYVNMTGGKYYNLGDVPTLTFK